MKRAWIAAGLLVVAGATASCGGDSSEEDSPPESASVKEFCQSFEDFGNAMDDLDEDASTEDQIGQVKEEIEKVRDVGTPEDMPADARKGFEVFTQAILDVDDNATSEEFLLSVLKGFSKEERPQLKAFYDYAKENCGDKQFPF